ncbi:hypothetical protein ACOSP7_004073 [Xanthoceras sorbifolium]
MVRTFLKGKGKLSHLLGTGPQEGDLKFEAWDEKDFMIMSWLWNSMTPEISETCMFLSSAKDIWEATRQTYSKVKDAAQVYKIKTKTSSIRQGSKSRDLGRDRRSRDPGRGAHWKKLMDRAKRREKGTVGNATKAATHPESYCSRCRSCSNSFLTYFDKCASCSYTIH